MAGESVKNALIAGAPVLAAPVAAPVLRKVVPIC